MKEKQIISWCLYDFANSFYSTVIIAVVFPVYFVKVIAPSPEIGDLWWGRSISISMIIVAFSSPLLGGIADYSGKRKTLLFYYTLVCVVSVVLLSLTGKGDLYLSTLLIILSNIAMEGATVFYNSYLPNIAKKQYYGRVSGWGFGLGYIGSMVSLLFSIFLIKKGMIYLAWPLVGVMFFLFSLPAFLFLPKDEVFSSLYKAAVMGINQTFTTLKKLFLNKQIRRFLIAYFVYKDAVNTVIVFSSIYASVTLSFNEKELMLLYLIVQFTAMIGAFGLSFPTDKWGAKKIVIISLFLWIIATIGAFIARDKTTFWFIAILAGFGLGSIQSASRSLFTGFIPYEKESEYFGVYSFIGKSSAVIGPFLFGTISYYTGSQRIAILTLVILFIIGLFFLVSVKEFSINYFRH